MTGVDLGDSKLKPCPFCGSDIVHLNKNKIGYHQVICYNLGCYANVWGATKQEAINSWNRRATKEEKQILHRKETK